MRPKRLNHFARTPHERSTVAQTAVERDRERRARVRGRCLMVAADPPSVTPGAGAASARTEAYEDRDLCFHLQVYRDRAPLRRTMDTAEIAEAALFLLSDAGRAVTAEVLFADGGYHATGM